MKPHGLTEYPEKGVVWEYLADKWAFCYCCMNVVPEGKPLFEDWLGTYDERCWGLMQKARYRGESLLVTGKAPGVLDRKLSKKAAA